MKTLFLVVNLVGLNALAGGVHVGNGGVGFLCEAGDKKEVRVLDLTEMTAPFENTVTKGKREQVVKHVLENLRRLNSKLSDQYSREFENFDNNIEFKPDSELTETKDTLHVASPKNCKVKQLAIRRTETDSLTKEFIVDQDAWKLMDEKNRAALTLHEIIYKHFSKLGEENSVKARKMTGYLMSDRAFKDSPENFWTLVRELKLPIYQ